MKKYTKWHKKNVHPDCKNPDCQRMDRGGACGQCIDHADKVNKD